MRKQAPSTYLDASPDAIFVADPEGRIEFVSRRGVALLGHSSTGDLLGRSLGEFVEGEDVDLVLDMLRNAERGPTELRIRPQGRAPVWTEANAEQVRGSGGRGRVVLVVRDVSRRKLVEEELRLAKAAAEETAARLGRSLEALQLQAATDSLTGLWNRRHFGRVMAVELARCRRYSQLASVILFDVDHFKAVNDRLGHDAGDRALVAIARAIVRTARTSDTTCRWGGEEFAVLTPGVSGPAAVRLADRIREEIEGANPGGDVRVTLSGGVAQLDPTETLEEGLKRADEALYRAKRGGRNRVELAPGRGDTPEHRLVQLVWDPAYECGDALIDEQHRQLFALGNAVLDEAMSGAPNAAVRGRLSALLTHVVAHFAEEEQLLERIGYADRVLHRSLHRALVDEALRLQSQLEEGRVGVQELLGFLVVRVVQEHLLGADTLFFPAVAASTAGRADGPGAPH